MSTSDERCAGLYLDLLKRCLANTIYCEYERVELLPWHGSVKRSLFEMLVAPLLRKSGAGIANPYDHSESSRIAGKDWPLMAHTMIGLKRLDNLQYCVEQVISNGIPGDLIETGVWRGGATILMRAVLKAYAVTDRKVFVADSFAGLPEPDAAKYPQDKGVALHKHKNLSVSLEQVKRNFGKYGLLDEQVCFLEGWFKETLPAAPIEKLAVLRLDGDLYESTLDALKNLYHKLSAGGFLIIDDYGALDSCKAAVHDFRKERAIREEIVPIDWAGVYWQKLR
ncbi:MAG: TylF/MycF family methyltransferase [Elusimicrobia bacterium]|nr:TylF/MycF family methyltransferase [Elusimicrobiota bacterium]